MRKFEFTDKYIKELEDDFMTKWLDDKFFDYDTLLDREERFEQDFEIYLDELREINLPQRATKGSAGYDFKAIEDINIPSMPRQFIDWFGSIEDKDTFKRDIMPIFNEDCLNPTMVRTGIRAYMNDGEVLKLYSRSSMPKKYKSILPNSVGIIDSDYIQAKNNGEIFLAFWNFSLETKIIKKGERIGQGVFSKYLVTDDDITNGKRSGGHGSTGE